MRRWFFPPGHGPRIGPWPFLRRAHSRGVRRLELEKRLQADAVVDLHAPGERTRVLRVHRAEVLVHLHGEHRPDAPDPEDHDDVFERRQVTRPANEVLPLRENAVHVHVGEFRVAPRGRFEHLDFVVLTLGGGIRRLSVELRIDEALGLAERVMRADHDLDRLLAFRSFDHDPKTSIGQVDSLVWATAVAE